ncbi:MAG: hypothetical protein ACTS4T_01865, partial [Candidatus Hodgkinia cicadicola]
IYKHNTNNKLIEEQIQINTKHDTLFEALNVEKYLHTWQKHTNGAKGGTNSTLTKNTSSQHQYNTRKDWLKMGPHRTRIKFQ